ncbi:MAG: hypothetical protein V4628_11770 [Pseudomonadota bacterium]
MRQQEELTTQMQLAKEALLAFAANSSSIYSNERGPGFFPCPDKTNSGAADADCDSSSVNLGRLPEYVDVEDNKLFFNSYYSDTSGQFWYAVAPNYVYSAANENSRRAQNRTSVDSLVSANRLTLDGTGDVVALIIAPGEPLAFQNRTAGLLAVNFLEGENVGSDLNFSSGNGATTDTFNDRVIAITHNDVMQFIGMKAATEIKRLLDEDYESQSEPRHYPGDPVTSLQTADEFHADFASVMTSNPWLTDDPAGNKEQWATDILYTLLLETEASIQFKGCPNMSFKLVYGGGITPTGKFC